MKLLQTLLICLTKAAFIITKPTKEIDKETAPIIKQIPVDTRPIPVMKKIQDVSLTKGDHIEIPLGGLLGGTNLKYEVSEKHRPGASDTNGINFINRVHKNTTLKMSDVADNCRIAKGISDTKFYALCDKTVLHYVEFKISLRYGGEYIINKEASWNKEITKDTDTKGKIEKCFDMAQVDSRFVVVCKLAPEEKNPSKLYFAFVKKDSLEFEVVSQKKEESYDKNFALTVFNNTYLILRQRFSQKKLEPAIFKTFKIWKLNMASTDPPTKKLTNERFVNISKLKGTSLSDSKEIGSTINIKNIEYAFDSLWISGTDYIAPPVPPSSSSAQTLGQIPIVKPHNVYRVFRFSVSLTAITPVFKDYLVIPFEKDEDLQNSGIKVTSLSSNKIITIVTKKSIYQGIWNQTKPKSADENPKYFFKETLRSEFLCPMAQKNYKNDHISDIQYSRDIDERGVLVTTHGESHEQSQTIGLLDKYSGNYDCIDNAGQDGYEILVDYNTLILGKDKNINFYDVEGSTKIWFDYKGLSKNENFLKNKPTEVTLTGKMFLPGIFDRKGDLKFNITLYEKWNTAMTSKNPFEKEVTVYENSWIKLPFNSKIIRANNPEFSLFEAGKQLKEEDKKFRIKYFAKHEVKLELEGLTGNPDQIFSADEDTFVAVKYTAGQNGKYWVFDCNESELTSKFECQKAPTSFELDDPNQYIKYTGKLGKTIFIIIATKVEQYKTMIRYIDDEKKTLHEEKIEEAASVQSPIFFNNKDYGFMIYIMRASSSGKTSRVSSRTFYYEKDGTLKTDTEDVIPSSQVGGCPLQQIYYGSSNDPDSYRKVFVKVHCAGEEPRILQFLLDPSLNSKSAREIKNKNFKKGGFSFCPAGDEGFMYYPFKRRLKSFSWSTGSEYDYNLFEVGITQPLLTNCVGEKNLFQILGRDPDGKYILANFLGGNLNDPTRRVHSVIKLEHIPITNVVTGIATANKAIDDKISIMISHKGEAAKKRYVFQFHLEGPEVYYKAPTTKIGEKMVTLQTMCGRTLTKSSIKVNPVERKDALKLEVIGKAKVEKGKIDLEKYMKITGHLVDLKLKGPTDVIEKKVFISNSRKNQKKGFDIGTKNIYDQLEVQGKWMIGLIKGKSIEFLYNPNSLNESKVVKNIENTFVSFRISKKQTVENGTNVTLVCVRRFKKNSVRYMFFKLSTKDTEDGKKEPQVISYDGTYISYGIRVGSDYKIVYPKANEFVYLIEEGTRGAGLSFRIFNWTDHRFGFKIVNKNSNWNVTIKTKHKISSFNSLIIKGYLVVFYASEETDSLHYIVWSRGSNPLTYTTKVHDKENISPEDIDCQFEKDSTTVFTCFIDTISDKDYIMKYTIKDDFFDFNDMFKSKEKLASYLSPPGFQSVKIDRTADLTGILYKNTEVKQAAQLTSRPFGFNLKAAKSIYECEYILSLYKPGSEYSYTTFTCEDFGDPKKGTAVDFALETIDSPSVWITYKPKPDISLQQAPVSSSSSSSVTPEPKPKPKPGPIASFRIGKYEITAPSSGVDWSKIKFQAIGNDGKEDENSKTIGDFISYEEKKNKSSGSRLLMWIMIIIIVIIIIVVVVGVLKKGEGSQESGSYITAPKEVAKEDMDDSVL